MDAGSLPLVETSPAVAIGPFCLPGPSGRGVETGDPLFEGGPRL